MKKEVILVPQGKCPMDVLAEMGEKTKNAWIFLHENAYQHLMKSKGAQVYTKNTENCNKITLIKWEATEDFPETSVCIEEPHAKGWGKIASIYAEDIAHELSPDDPEDLFFLKMEE